ncbi:LysR family transcriptional regulator [Leisingera thetidis]|uniref:LysR family transcriptional regulator n=1 Tax=Leisingera thetidis TaxID=2930199 RepID=UPI0021F6BFE5|nr:LysR family transcriptional regulator [Leisingera thetidis]
MGNHLNDMVLFVEVVKARSFRGAAKAAGVPNSTLSRRITALETAIGLRLLHRTTRRVEPTEAGQLYFDRCKRIVEEARVAHEELGEMVTQPSGTLHLSLPVDFAIVWLGPLFPKFAAKYPGIDFDLDLTPRNVDLISEPYDLAIRMAAPQADGLISRVIGRVRFKLYASPGYLAANGSPAHPADLSQHNCLTMPNLKTWQLHSDSGSADAQVQGRFTVNSVGLLRNLAVQGMGILFMSEHVVAEDLAAGRIKRVLPGWQGVSRPIHVVTESKLLPAKTQRFIEFLQEELALNE